MAEQILLTNLENGIYTIQINRPDKMNALNIQLVTELGELFDEVYSNDEIRSVLITGVGEKAFAAGADIAEFTNFNEEEGMAMGQRGHQVLNKIEQCPKPVLAVVNGFALGGGCELAMACHMRICSDNASFGQPEVKLGIIPGYGGTQRLISLVGRGRATELLLSARAIDATEAHRIGLVNSVHSLEDLLPFAIKLLGKIGNMSALNIAQIIKLTNAHADKTVDGFAEEIKEFGSCFSTSDYKEGTTAFLEKRRAEFKGK